MHRAEQPHALLLKIEQAAETLNVSRATVYVLITSGELPTVKIGTRGVRIPAEALREWIVARQRVAVTA